MSILGSIINFAGDIVKKAITGIKHLFFKAEAETGGATPAVGVSINILKKTLADDVKATVEVIKPIIIKAGDEIITEAEELFENIENKLEEKAKDILPVLEEKLIALGLNTVSEAEELFENIENKLEEKAKDILPVLEEKLIALGINTVSKAEELFEDFENKLEEKANLVLPELEAVLNAAGDSIVVEAKVLEQYISTTVPEDLSIILDDSLSILESIEKKVVPLDVEGSADYVAPEIESALNEFKNIYGESINEEANSFVIAEIEYIQADDTF